MLSQHAGADAFRGAFISFLPCDVSRSVNTHACFVNGTIPRLQSLIQLECFHNSNASLAAYARCYPLGDSKGLLTESADVKVV